MISQSCFLVAAASLSIPLLCFGAPHLPQSSNQDADKNTTYEVKLMVSEQNFKRTMTTIFWIGEDANAENAFIPNYESYWDPNWLSNFGGVDSPDDRNGYMPAAFTPRQNPFYIALPFGEADEHGILKESAKKIPG